ncbi:MAG: hypothetical protein KIS65_05780 [Nitrosomonas sp.]|nr:hypothetical protein [Nitrosomonas sp.]
MPLWHDKFDAFQLAMHFTSAKTFSTSLSADGTVENLTLHTQFIRLMQYSYPENLPEQRAFSLLENWRIPAYNPYGSSFSLCILDN